MKVYRLLLRCITALVFLTLLPGAMASDIPLPMNEAFQLSATAKDEQTLVISWDIAPGYYLYRDQFRFSLSQPNVADLAPPLLPPSEWHNIVGLGNFQVYTKQVNITVPVIRARESRWVLNAAYQGCSEKGYCYPPATQALAVDLNRLTVTKMQPPIVAIPQTATPESNLSAGEQLLMSASQWTVFFSFIGFGILISLTPCVLPMVPVLSAIILGGKPNTTPRAFTLSLAYVLAMAITYSIAGMLFAFLGGTVTAFLQQPWIIILFSLLFVALALSLFGFYSIQLPEKIRSRMADLSSHQKRGSIVGVMGMGVLSTLILSPCVTPPLAGVLAYISHSGNVVLGGMALFALGLGMGAPLLLIGILGNRILPKTGHWMTIVNKILGVLLLVVAVSLLGRVLPASVTLLLYAALSLGVALNMGALNTAVTHRQLIVKSLGLVLFVYAVVLVIGATQGSTDPLRPLNRGLSAEQNVKALHWMRVKTVDEVNHALSLAGDKPVLLDFYADWCASCRQMDFTLFQNPRVVKRLSHYVLLRADVTQNDAADQALQQHFQVIAPPTLLFFNQHHQEIQSARIVGELSAAAFLQQLPQR